MSSKRVFPAALMPAALALAILALAVPIGPAAKGQTNSTAPGDTKSVTAPKPAAEEKPVATETKAAATDGKAAEPKKRSKAEIEAFLSKCSQEADEKGLTKAKNKLAERKAYRRQCMSKFGVDAKS